MKKQQTVSYADKRSSQFLLRPNSISVTASVVKIFLTASKVIKAHRGHISGSLPLINNVAFVKGIQYNSSSTKLETISIICWSSRTVDRLDFAKVYGHSRGQLVLVYIYRVMFKVCHNSHWQGNYFSNVPCYAHISTLLMLNNFCQHFSFCSSTCFTVPTLRVE